MGTLDEWRYCPRCGEAIEKRDGQAVCGTCGFRAYANSVPGVEAVIVDRAGRVLLGRRTIEPALGRWDFPGGFLDENEEPLDSFADAAQGRKDLDVSVSGSGI